MDIKKEKLINAIIFFAKKMFLTKTKLMKCLYELDFRHFKETGRSVTGLQYYAWDKGPVPNEVYNKFTKDGEVTDYLKDFIRIIPLSKGIRIINRKEPDLRYFTKREIKILKEVIDIYKNADTDMMIGASHEVNKPWDITKKTKGLGNIIDYLLSIDDKSPLKKEEVINKQEEMDDIERLFNAIQS